MVIEFFCNICHEAYGSSQDIRSTACGHVFHHRCLTDWLARSTTCPECRRACSKWNLLKIFIKSRTVVADDHHGGTNMTLMSQLEHGVKKLSETQHLLDESEKNFAELSNKLDAVTKELTVLSIQNHGGKGGNLKTVMDLPDCGQSAGEFKKRPGGNRPRLDQETFNLFQYAKNLRKVGYKDVFFKGPEIYVRKNTAHPKIHIRSRDEVDDLLDDEEDSWY